jgi:hypothetical protein
MKLDLKRAMGWYKGAALMLLNTIVFFVILNLGLWAVITARHWNSKDPFNVSHGYSTQSLRIVYPDLTDAQRTALLTEIWVRPMVYAQFTGFKEQPFHGQYVNVTEQGFRVNPPQGPWPIDPKNFNIFVFGGSTTFGYGVADDQTIPFYLQSRLAKSNHGDRRICVYNFGCAYYDSTQERILFEQLLQSRVKPDLALFIDGLNDFYFASGVLPFTPQLTKAMDPHTQGITASNALQFGRDLLDMSLLLPVGRLTGFLTETHGPGNSKMANSEIVSQVIDNYIWNKKARELIGKANGVATVFVFQPVPMFKYDLKYHLFQAGANRSGWDQNVNAFEGYPRMAKYMTEHPMGNDFLWLADIQEGKQKPLYCDQVHYTPEFADEIAGDIEKFLATQNATH